MGIKIKVILTILTLTYSSCGMHQEPPKKNHDLDFSGRMVHDDTLLVRLINSGDSKVFLFQSYFSNRFYKSKYLIRLNQEENVVLSFVPILGYTGTVKSDKLILNDKSVLTRNQVVYSFKELDVGDTVEIVIPISAINAALLQRKQIVLDFDPKVVAFDEIKMKSIKVHEHVYVEFAIFSKIDLLISQGAEYKFQEEFINQAKDYVVVRKKFLMSPLSPTMPNK